MDREINEMFPKCNKLDLYSINKTALYIDLGIVECANRDLFKTSSAGNFNFYQRGILGMSLLYCKRG